MIIHNPAVSGSLTFANGASLTSHTSNITGSFKGDLSATNGIFSSSEQVNADTIQQFDSNVQDVINDLGLVSQSAQINANSIINFDSNVKTKINADGVISGSSQLTTTFDTRYVNATGNESISGNKTFNNNVVITGDLDVAGTTNFTSTNQVNIGDNVLNLNYGGGATDGGIYVTDVTAGGLSTGSFLWSGVNDRWVAGTQTNEVNVLLAEGDGIVSQSAQISFNSISDKPSGIVSSSSQITDGSGIVSESQQLQTDFDSRYLNTNSDGVFSQSVQINHDSTTGFVSNEHIDHSSVTITAGTGLTGGGTIESTRTLNVIGGDGITANANDIEVDSTVLRTDGFGIISGSDQLTGFISKDSNFTNNELIVATGTNTVVSSNILSLDTSNNYLGINQSNPSVTLHMTGEGAQSAQIRMEQHNDTSDAPDIRTRKSRGTAASPTKNNAGDYIYRQNSERHNGTGYVTVGQFAVDTNSSNADRFQLTLAVSEDGGAVDASTGVQFKIDGNDSGAITFNGAYKFPTSDGTNGQSLVTNGSGVLSFGSPIANLNGSGVISGSVLRPDGDGVVSESLQIDVTATTNYSSINQYSDTKVTDRINDLVVVSGSASEVRTFINVENNADVTDSTNVVSSLVSATGISGGNKGTIQSNLGVDSAGTKNSTDVSLAGSYNYITAGGTDNQTLTLGQVDASTDISNLTTNNVSEGTNQYFTNARVKTKLTAEDVVSGSQQILNLVSVDEDNMSSNSNTKLPTQQSVKAYVDTQLATKDNLSELSGDSDDVSEGTTNLYYTDARVSSRINELGIVSESLQIDVTSTTNYSSINQYSDTKVKTKLTAEDVVSGSKSEVLTFLNVEDGATADQSQSDIQTLLGTGNNALVPTAGSAGQFLKHDGTFGTPSYTTNTNTNQLTTFTVRDDDNDDFTISQGKFIKFVSTTGTAGTNITGTGTTSDPYLVTITSPDTTTNTMGTGFTVSATTDTTATTITQGDDLFFAAGTGIGVETTADGTVTITNTSTNVNTNQLTTFIVRDDDDDEKEIAQDKFIKFTSAVGAAGTNLSGTGTTGDPFVLAITSPNDNDNTQNAYSVSIPSSTTKLRLSGTGADGNTTDDIEFVGSGATTVTRTNENKFTISSTDNNDNTQNTTTLSFVDSSNDIILRNTTGGAGSGNQDININAGSNITLTHTDANNIEISSTDTDTVYTHPNHTGDVTSVADGATTIGANKVTHAKYQQVATDTIIGRTAIGTGNVTALTDVEVRGIIGTGNGKLVPSAGSSGEFLKHDGTFGTPSYTTNTDINVDRTNLKARLAQFDSTDTVYIGDSDDDTTVIIRGTLQVDGTTTTVNSNTLSVGDNTIVLNNDVTGTPTEDAGINIERGTSTNASLIWDESEDYWVAGLAGSEVQIALTNGDYSGLRARGTTAEDVGLGSAANSDHTAQGYATVTGTETLTNKTLTSPDINGGTADALTSLTIANNVDVGNFQIRAKTFQSDVATGTAPFTVASTTKVTNLNADLLDGISSAAFLRSNATDTASGVITFSNTTNSTTKTTGAVKISGGVGIALSLNVGEDIVAYASSDERYKDNVTRIENPNEKLKQIGGYTFDWNDNHEIFKGQHDVGVIAQEIEKVLPEIVETRESGYKAVKYEKIVALLIESNKELLERIEELENKLK